MGIYILVFFACIAIGVIYVITIRGFLSRLIKSPIPSPFAFGKEFIQEWKKFGIVYFAGDVVKFVIENFILGTENAIVIRLVSIMLTFSTSGFFGRRRTLVVRKIRQDVKHHLAFWEFMGDTFASLVFRVPMYIIQLMVLIYFNLTCRESVWFGVYVQMGAVLIFGRFGCFAADLLENWLFSKKN